MYWLIVVLLASFGAKAAPCPGGVIGDCSLDFPPEHVKGDRLPDGTPPPPEPVPDAATGPAVGTRWPDSEDRPQPGPRQPPAPEHGAGMCDLDPSCSVTRQELVDDGQLCEDGLGQQLCLLAQPDSLPMSLLPEDTGATSQDVTTAATVGDPIVASSGALSLRLVDVALPGPVAPLTFARSYSSRGTGTSSLGASWVHEYEMRVQPLRVRDDARPEVCWDGDERCALVLDGQGNERLFVRFVGQSFYVEPTGTTDTLTREQAGWALVDIAGNEARFDDEGALIERRDRDGNGVSVEQEPVPLYAMYRDLCAEAGRGGASSNEDPRFCATLAAAFGDAPARQWPAWQLDGGTNRLVDQKCDYRLVPDLSAGRQCRALSPAQVFSGVDTLHHPASRGGLYLEDVLAVKCGDHPPRWGVVSRMNPLVPALGQLDALIQGFSSAANGCTFYDCVEARTIVDTVPRGDRGFRKECSAETWVASSGKLAWPEPTREKWVAVGKDFLPSVVAFPRQAADHRYSDAQWASLEQLLAQGFVDLRPIGGTHGMYLTTPLPAGSAKHRVRAVRDDLGRKLTFRYVEGQVGEPASFEREGLLRDVSGPGFVLRFDYNRPPNAPARFREEFLTRVTRKITEPSYAPLSPEGRRIESREASYVYGWPDSRGQGGYADGVRLLAATLGTTHEGQLATAATVQQYLRSAADNIIEVHRKGDHDEDVVEVTTAYDLDPWSPTLDRAVEQVAGDLAAAQRDGALPEHASPMTLEYAFAASDGAPAVAGWLPAATLKRYADEQAHRGGRASDGYAPSPEALAVLHNTRRADVSCSEMARESLKALRDASTTVDLVEHRAKAADDLERVCAWTHVFDQDEREKVLGFNFLGHLLVEASVTTDHSRAFYVDRQTDVDGAVVVESTVSDGPVFLPSGQGRAVYSYDYGFASKAAQEGTAKLWRARHNLTRAREVPDGGRVVETLGRALDGETSVEVVSHEKTYEYEPISFQVKRTLTSAITESGSVPLHEVLIEHGADCTVEKPAASDCELSFFLCQGGRERLAGLYGASTAVLRMCPLDEGCGGAKTAFEAELDEADVAAARGDDPLTLEVRDRLGTVRVAAQEAVRGKALVELSRAVSVASAALEICRAAGARAIVSVGLLPGRPANGERAALARAVKAGVTVVQSTRGVRGSVGPQHHLHPG